GRNCCTRSSGGGLRGGRLFNRGCRFLRSRVRNCSRWCSRFDVAGNRLILAAGRKRQCKNKGKKCNSDQHKSVKGFKCDAAKNKRFLRGGLRVALHKNIWQSVRHGCCVLS